MVSTSKKSTRYTGGCLCGATRFEARGIAKYPHTCSCTQCRRHTGAFTVAWVEFDKDEIQWTGKAEMPATYRSSAGSSRAFCKTCGTSLGAIDDAPTIALLLGVFDKPNSKELRPTKHSYRGQRPKWWCVEIAT